MEKNSAISAFHRQNDGLLHIVHVVRDCTKRGENEHQVVLNDLVGISDTRNSLYLSSPQYKFYGEKMISENQISSSH